MQHWWKFVAAMQISSNFFSFIICSATSIVGCSLANSNVCVKLVANSSHSRVPHRISIDVYQFLGTIFNVCMDRWTHSCRRYSCHVVRQCSICSTGFVNHVYLQPIYLISSPNLISNNLLHCVNLEIDCLCVPSSRQSFQHNVQGRQLLRFYNFCFRFF